MEDHKDTRPGTLRNPSPVEVRAFRACPTVEVRACPTVDAFALERKQGKQAW